MPGAAFIRKIRDVDIREEDLPASGTFEVRRSLKDVVFRHHSVPRPHDLAFFDAQEDAVHHQCAVNVLTGFLLDMQSVSSKPEPYPRGLLPIV